MVWYFHLLKNFPQFFVVHTVKGFGIVNKAEADIFLKLFCFFDDPKDVDSLISGSSALVPLPFLKPTTFKIYFLSGKNGVGVWD